MHVAGMRVYHARTRLIAAVSSAQDTLTTVEALAFLFPHRVDESSMCLDLIDDPWPDGMR